MSNTYDLTRGSKPWEVEFLWSNEPADTDPHVAIVSARWYEEALRLADVLLTWGPAIGKDRHPVFIHARPAVHYDTLDDPVVGANADEGSPFLADVA